VPAGISKPHRFLRHDFCSFRGGFDFSLHHHAAAAAGGACYKYFHRPVCDKERERICQYSSCAAAAAAATTKAAVWPRAAKRRSLSVLRPALLIIHAALPHIHQQVCAHARKIIQIPVIFGPDLISITRALARTRTHTYVKMRS
jgi:hypothetical protein